MLKTEEIESITDAQNYVEGCLNDFSEGLMEKEEFMNCMLNYTMRIADQAQPILLSGYLKLTSEHFSAERNKKRIVDEEKNKELTSHLGSALTVIESSIKNELKKMQKK